MNKPTLVVTFGIFLCLLITMSQIITAAPTYSDYDNIRDLYELLMEKELMADAYEQPQHRLVRKNSRSPSLRLRFGRRSDPSIGLYQDNSNEHQFQNLPDMTTNE